MADNYKKGWDEGASGKPFDHSLESDKKYMNGWLDGYNSAKASKAAVEELSEETVEV